VPFIFELVSPLVRLVGCFKGYSRLWMGLKNVDARPSDRFDYHVPLLSIPGILNTTVETVSRNIPYISPEPHLVEIWKRRMGNDIRFKVGIVWADHPEHNNDRNRSVYLSLFKDLSHMEDLMLFSLQKNKSEEWTDINPDQILLEKDLGKNISDLADTAVIIENFDLVISIDTSVVHLAGVLEKQIWTLLPFAPDWRWMLDRNDTPWHPTMKLFRQSHHDDWDPVFMKVKMELEKLLLTD
jgi:hypothetical protein